ncbi:DUF58 domain-containing protein [Persicobacter sp. CCB-QB2]|uniref:DUF58 domain-containing protein n=1 Tax=Persicobacter sp. CCB-QB2 TaxID=1561025 RepID=UPI0006A9C654|nr:DUF58 domain-containing protein [Persicobacter sp. CCB-QB2]
MNYPEEVAIGANALLRMEYAVNQGDFLPPKPVFSLLAGKHASKLRGRGLDFEEVRRYVPGDDIRHIDWKVTARTKVTHSKVFNEEKERPAFVICDQSSAMFFGSVRYTKSVIAAQLAAISAFKILKQGDRIGGIVFDDDQIAYVQPKRNRKSLMYFLDQIAAKNLALPKKTSLQKNTAILNQALYQAETSVSKDFVITLITDMNYANEETYARLIRLSRHNDVIIVHISDPMDEALNASDMVITDGKKQLLWDGNRKNAGKKYASKQSVLSESLEKMERYGMPVLTLNTIDSLEKQLNEILTERRGR